VPLTQQWAETFFRTVQVHETAVALKEAAVAGALTVWTERLTAVVITACTTLGWRPAAKGHLGEVLPVARHEYLALDVMAFPTTRTARWLFPAAVFELENSSADERVAYSLWKVLCIRVPLRVVFAYRRDVREGITLVSRLTEVVIGSLPVAERMALTGETVLIIGNRGEVDTFPYGYFKVWALNANTGHFERA
jgi:hypothetical protein